MARSFLQPQDIAWEAARRAERRHPHPPETMRSGCSAPPRRMWICDVCCAVDYSFNLTPTICYGGYSRSTAYQDDY